MVFIEKPRRFLVPSSEIRIISFAEDAAKHCVAGS